MIEVQRVSKDGLHRQVWQFNVAVSLCERLPVVRLYRYVEQSCKSTRALWSNDRIFRPLMKSMNDLERVEVPIPDDVRKEVLDAIISKISFA